MKKFVKIMKILILLYYVHLGHIVQVLLMMYLIIVKEKMEKYDLTVVIMLDVFKVVLLLHKIQQNLRKNGIDYYVHVVMHVCQFKLVLFEGIESYNCKVLKENEIVQLLHVITTEFDMNFKRKRKKENGKKKERKTRKNNNDYNNDYNSDYNNAATTAT